MKWGSPKEIETRRRIKLLIWAYAYEKAGNSIVSDAVFDREARKVNVDIATDRPDLDKWFKENFVEHTGSWIYCFPELDRIKEIYSEHYKRK